MYFLTLVAGRTVVPFLVGCATRPCAWQGCGTSAGIPPAIPWRKPVLLADSGCFSWNKLGLAAGDFELGPHRDPSSFAASTAFGAKGCRTSAGVGSLSPAVPWRKPGLPADVSRSSPRRTGRPVRAVELGPRRGPRPGPCSAAVSCCSRGRSPGRAKPCHGRRGATAGTCFGPSLGPWRGHRCGPCRQTRGAGGLRNATTSFPQSGAEVSLLEHGCWSHCAA